MRSVNPPCPGMTLEKSLIFKALLNPEANKPPKGANKEAKIPNDIVWKCIVTNGIVIDPNKGKSKLKE